MRRLLPLLTAICLLMMSCQSSEIVTVEKVVVPELVFPEFPKIKRTVNADGSWTIPEESTKALAVYYEQIQKTEAEYNGLRELYEKFYEKDYE